MDTDTSLGYIIVSGIKNVPYSIHDVEYLAFDSDSTPYWTWDRGEAKIFDSQDSALNIYNDIIGSNKYMEDYYKASIVLSDFVPVCNI